MVRRGLFSEQSPVAEHRPSVWRCYRELVRTWGLASSELELLLLREQFGLYTDPSDPESELNWALVTPIVDPCMPFTGPQLREALPGLCVDLRQAGLTLLTDTFCLLDGYPPAPGPCLVGLNSPVAALHPSFEAYLASLTLHRRQKYRHLARTYETPRFRFELSPRALDEQELSFAREQLLLRWGETDLAYALIQTLWPQAVALCMPEAALFARVYEQDRLVFVQTLLLRQGGVYTQSIFKSQQDFFDGIGPWTDFACVRALCGTEHQFLDPSCRATWTDPPSIEVAKRATVNQDRVKPLLAFGAGLPAELTEAQAAGQVQGQPART